MIDRPDVHHDRWCRRETSLTRLAATGQSVRRPRDPRGGHPTMIDNFEISEICEISDDLAVSMCLGLGLRRPAG